MDMRQGGSILPRFLKIGGKKKVEDLPEGLGCA